MVLQNMMWNETDQHWINEIVRAATSSNSQTTVISPDASAIDVVHDLKRKFIHVEKIIEASGTMLRGLRSPGYVRGKVEQDFADRLIENCIKHRNDEVGKAMDAILDVLQKEYNYAKDSVNCGICYNSLSEKGAAMLRNCGHIFCQSCSDIIRNTTRVCPKCRADISDCVKCIL